MSVQPQSTPTPAASGGSKGLAIASLVLGILSLCASIGWWCGGPLSVIGLVLGFLGRKSAGKGLATAGIILSAIGLVLTIVFIIVRLVAGPVMNGVFNQIQNQLGTGGY
jgi:hypothetical protein